MWDTGLAKMFKERDKESKIGPCIGKIVSVSPLKISILDGSIVLQENQLYITRSLFNREYKLDLTADGSLGEVSPSGELTNLDISKGNAKIYFELKSGNEVLLIPAESEQVFFIIDVVQKVGG